MEKKDSIIIENDGIISFICLNRPEKKNALDKEIFQGLINFFENPSLNHRVAVISAKGSDFCSGADLSWMLNSNEMDRVKSSSLLVELYSAMRKFPYPIITRIFGKVLAGGVGIAAASDIVFAKSDTVLGLPEVRTGLVPAVMAPFLVERIGLARFRELSLTGRSITAIEALDYGLIDFIESKDAEVNFDFIINEIKKGGPKALSTTKKICNSISFANWQTLTTELSSFLAEARQGDEAIEGINAFYERRDPNWMLKGLN